MRESARVLVVDDDPDLRDLTAVALARRGYRVLAAATGAEALALVEQTPPDLILLDQQMPDVCGRGFADAYRRTPGPHAPILAVTAATDSAGFAAEIGAAGALPKPFSLAQLFAAVDALADG